MCLGRVLQGIMENFLEEKASLTPGRYTGFLQRRREPPGAPSTAPCWLSTHLWPQPDLGDLGSNPDSSIYPQVSLLPGPQFPYL